MSTLVVVIVAILLIDGGLELRSGDYWGAVRTLLIAALLPLVLRGRSKADGPGTS